MFIIDSYYSTKQCKKVQVQIPIQGCLHSNTIKNTFPAKLYSRKCYHNKYNGTNKRTGCNFNFTSKYSLLP